MSKVTFDYTKASQFISEHDYILLDDVIVTALGLQKKESALSYAAIQVDKDELVQRISVFKRRDRRDVIRLT